MNAVAATGIGTAPNTNIGVGEIFILAGSEIPANGSPAATGSSLETGGSWKELLHALGLMKCAAPASGDGNTGLPEPTDVESISGQTAEDVESKLSDAPRSTFEARAKRCGESSRARCGEVVAAHLRKHAEPAGASERPADAPGGALFAPSPLSAVPVAGPAVLPDDNTHSAEAKSQQRSPEPLSLPAISDRDEVRMATASETGIARDFFPQLKGHEEQNDSHNEIQVKHAPVTPAPVVDLEAGKKGNRGVSALPAAAPAGNSASESDHRVVEERRASVEILDVTQKASPDDPSGASARVVEHAADRPPKPPEHPGDAQPKPPVQSNSQTRVKISGAAQTQVEQVSSSPTIQPARPANKIVDAASNPLIAPPIHMAGRSAGLAEPSAGAVHQASAIGDPFVVLDGEHNPPAPAWIHAGTHHAEAGYLDPTVGWIGVRADSASNGLHATLVPNSAEAAQMLGSHLAGLNAYLAEHRPESATVIVAAPQDGLRDSLLSGNANDQSFARHQGGHQGSEPSGNRNDKQSGAEAFERNPRASVSTNTTRAPTGPGKYISVMA